MEAYTSDRRVIIVLIKFLFLWAIISNYSRNPVSYFSVLVIVAGCIKFVFALMRNEAPLLPQPNQPQYPRYSHLTLTADETLFVFLVSFVCGGFDMF